MQSKQWTINNRDIKDIIKWTAIFFAAPILIYFAQITADLETNKIITTLVPNAVTIGAIESWAVGIAINFFLSLKKGK